MSKPTARTARARLVIPLTLALVAVTAVSGVLTVVLVTRVTSPAPQPVAFIIGDSQAMGSTTVSSSSTWVAQGVAGLGYLPYVQGASGTGFVTAPDVGGSLEPFPEAYEDWEKPETPSLIVIEGGGNDIGAVDEAIAEAATELVQAIGADYPGVPVVVVAPIGDGTGRRAEIAAALEHVAADEGALFIDPSAWWSKYDLERYLVDMRHLSAEGHAAAAELFTIALRAVGVSATRE